MLEVELTFQIKAEFFGGPIAEPYSLRLSEFRRLSAAAEPAVNDYRGLEAIPLPGDPNQLRCTSAVDSSPGVNGRVSIRTFCRTLDRLVSPKATRLAWIPVRKDELPG